MVSWLKIKEAMTVIILALGEKTARNRKDDF
jgi:hypothetical protein